MNTFIYYLCEIHSLINKISKCFQYTLFSLTTHNSILFCFCYCCCLYINTSSHIVSSNQIKNTTIINTLNFHTAKIYTECIGIDLSLLTGCSQRYTQPRSNGTKMNNFCFIIVLLYTHNEQSLSFMLSVWFYSANKTVTIFAQRNLSLSLVRSQPSNNSILCKCLYENSERNKYVIHACGNFSGLLTGIK